MEPTGERMRTTIEGETEFEHFHRYCLAPDLCQGLDVLDFASGEGYGSSILANVARSVTGVDVDPRAIAHAQTTYGGENVRFIQGSALDLPLRDASVGAVVSFETLEHVREHARFMRKLSACCAPADGLSSVPTSSVYSAPGEAINESPLLELTAARIRLFAPRQLTCRHTESASDSRRAHCEDLKATAYGEAVNGVHLSISRRAVDWRVRLS